MKKLSVIFCLVSLQLLIGSTALMAGGGWPKKKGTGFFKLGQYILSSNTQFNPDGSRRDFKPRVGVFSTSIYGEYGFTDRLTGIIYFPFFARSIQNNFQRQNGEIDEGSAINTVGDTDISIKYGLIVDKPIVVSATLTLGLPLGNPSGGNSGVLSTGDGEFNQLLTIEASHSFYPAPLYLTASAGLNNRSNDFSEEWRLGLEVGYTAGDFTFVGRLKTVQSFMNEEGSANNITQGVFGNNIEYTIVSPEVIYSISDKVGASFGVSKAVAGSVVLADLAYDIGISLEI